METKPLKLEKIPTDRDVIGGGADGDTILRAMRTSAAKAVPARKTGTAKAGSKGIKSAAGSVLGPSVTKTSRKGKSAPVAGSQKLKKRS